MSYNTFPPNPFPPNSKNVGGADPYVLPIATSEILGGVKIGNGLTINNETGVITNNNPTPYTPINYSTTEQVTGQKWIDGKEIYCKVFTDLSATISYNNWVNIAENSGVDSLIDFIAYAYENHIISGVGIEVRYDSTSGYFQVQGEVNIANARTITRFVAYYTKSESEV